MTLKMQIEREKLEAFCRRWRVAELAVFGSALREDFGPESDLDVLVSFEAGAECSLLDLGRMEDELAELVGRPVDLVSRAGIERSENWIRRRAILGSAETIYRAA